MTRFIFACIALAVAPVFLPSGSIAQEASKPAAYANYDALFDAFDKRRQVLVTKLDALRSRKESTPEDIQKLQGKMVELDVEYAASLKKYVSDHPKAKDLMPARFERAVTLSRLEDKLLDAVTAANEFLEHHADSDLAADVRYVLAQSLFRIPGREEDALKAMDTFLESHKERREADSVRMMRVRTMLFLDRVDDAKKELDAIAKLPTVKNDKGANAFIQGQRAALDWVGTELPGFSLTSTDGSAIEATELEGKPALIYFWDSTSNACLNELGFVQSIQKKHGESMNVIGISINESKTAFEQWIKRQKEKPAFRNAWVDRTANGSILKKLDIKVIPFSVLVDSRGKIYRYDVRSDDLLRYTPKLVKAK
ncbi:MAG: redoxin domain-containing protein [Planctomycetota bacterium]